MRQSIPSLAWFGWALLRAVRCAHCRGESVRSRPTLSRFREFRGISPPVLLGIAKPLPDERTEPGLNDEDVRIFFARTNMGAVLAERSNRAEVPGEVLHLRR